MYSYNTPQLSKTSSRFSQSKSYQSSLNMSDLSNSNSYGRSLYNNSTVDSEFVQQLAASNAEIDAARYEIQLLMTKAHAYSKNSGIANANPSLSAYPSRYSGTTVPKSSKSSFTPTNTGEFFESSMNRPI